MNGLVKVLVWGLGSAWLAVACASTDAKRSVWKCARSFDCTCVESSEPSGGVRVDRCLPADCCTLFESSAANSGVCSCVMNTPGLRPEERPDCAANAELFGGKAVEQCPPPGEAIVPGVCAAEGLSCSLPDPRTSSVLIGCCAGLVCKGDASSAPTCRSATAPELVFSSACEHDAASGLSAARTVLTTRTLDTSLGTVELADSIHSVSVGIARAGCLVSFEVSFGTTSCGLSLRVDAIGDRFVTREVSGDLSGCVGFEGDPSLPPAGRIVAVSEPPVGFSFDGFLCGLTDVESRGCMAGVFDFRIDGELAPSLTLRDQHLRFEGTACASRDAREAVCPR